MTDFAELPWHDAVILRVVIDRRQVDRIDSVDFEMLWPDDSRSTIRFVDCMAAEAKLNFGVEGEESVLSAEVEIASRAALAVQAKWEKIGGLPFHLKSFTIETNSTASTWTIHAREFVIVDALELRGK